MRLLRKIPETVVRLFPFGELEREEAFATSTDNNAPKTNQLMVEGKTNEIVGAERKAWMVTRFRATSTWSRIVGDFSRR